MRWVLGPNPQGNSYAFNSLKQYRKTQNHVWMYGSVSNFQATVKYCNKRIPILLFTDNRKIALESFIFSWPLLWASSVCNGLGEEFLNCHVKHHGSAHAAPMFARQKS